MFQTNPNSINNDNEDATRPVVARATHLAKLTTYPDFIDAAADIDMDQKLDEQLNSSRVLSPSEKLPAIRSQL